MLTNKLKLFSILVILVPIVYCANENGVLELNDETFNNAITQSNYFVMFFAPWCGHCNRLHPLWEKLAEEKHKEPENSVKIAKVDCTENKEVCSEHEITGYPTLRFFKLNERDSVKFKGTRDMAAFVSFINEQLNQKDNEIAGAEENKTIHKEHLIEFTDTNFHKQVSSGKHFVKFYAPWCSHCQRLAPTWEELAKALQEDDNISIGKIDCTVYRPICQDFEVKGYPTLLWIEDGKKIEKYSGNRELDVLSAYVKKMLGVEGKVAEVTEDKQQEKKAEDKKRVMQLSMENFKTVIANDITFVKFYAPWCGHCQKLSPTWDKLAEKMHTGRSDIKIAKVDCTEEGNRNLCVEEQVQGYPTLLIYKNGAKLAEYDGSRSLPELENYVQKTLGHDEL